MKVIFFGSDDFAGAHLRCLLEKGVDVCACVTQPDRPKGRGMKMILSPIKEIALEKGIDVLQPTDIKDPEFHSQLTTYHSQLFIVIAYGRILPQSVLDIPEWCSVNVHGSLLPSYRGAAPINWAVLNGEKETGLTIIRMTTTLDGGDMIARHVIPIGARETAQQIREQMMQEGPEVLFKALDDLSRHYADGASLEFLAQDEQAVSYAPKLTKELGRIDWAQSAEKIDLLVRGLTPWPKAYTFYQGKMLKILQGRVVALENSSQPPGTVQAASGEGILVQSGQGGFLIQNVHLESSKPMDAASFLRGYPLKVGDVLPG